MRLSHLLRLSLVFAGGGLALAADSGLKPVIPKYHLEQVILPSADEADMKYLAFPTLLPAGPNEVLVSFKRGYKHGGDKEAQIEAFRFDTAKNVASQRQVIAYDAGFIQQMAEWVRFPNGDIAVYMDVQHLGADGRNYRTGMRENRSRDGGKTFEGLKKSPLVDGRECGYPFDFIVEGNTTYMLVMGFGYRPGERWSVDVIKSTDNGGSWSFVRNLSTEFGIPQTESAFIRHGDGFIVSTVGYDQNLMARLHETDGNFKVRRQVELTRKYPFIERSIGRPRLFKRDGNLYLLGRNWRTTEPHGSKMELVLLKIDSASLAVTQWAILDNLERASVTDGYYAMPYFQERDAQTYLSIITYKGLDGRPPQIIRLEYLWNEIR